MNKIRLLSYLVAGLLLSNLVLAGFIVFGKKGPDGDAPRNRIIQKLNFDEEQVKHYDALIRVHRDDMDRTDKEIMVLKNKLYALLPENNADMKRDSLIEELGFLQMRIEGIHFNHFMDIRKLCREDQLKAYSELTSEIAGLFSHPRPRPRHKRN